MNTYIALFRGINIVGSHVLAMSDLKLLFERNRCSDVRTYIRSGNVVFKATAEAAGLIAGRLSAAISRSHGFEPRVFVLGVDGLERAVSGNPFPEAEDNPRSVHVFFLAAAPAAPDLERLQALKAATERFALKDRCFYLHTPDGFGQSKLAQHVERHLGVAATARNWRTVTTLLDMAVTEPRKGAGSKPRTRSAGARVEGRTRSRNKRRAGD